MIIESERIKSKCKNQNIKVTIESERIERLLVKRYSIQPLPSSCFHGRFQLIFQLQTHYKKTKI